MSFQRRRTSLERYEAKQLLTSERQVPFEETYVGQRMANEYFKIFGHILDYSSLSEVSEKNVAVAGKGRGQ